MRRMILSCVVAMMPLVLVAQGELPQVETQGALRPLDTMEAARGYEAVGRLDNEIGYCSAPLIADDLILTEAHCLLDARGRRLPDGGFTFRAGLRNGRAAAERGVAASHVPDSYRYVGQEPEVDGVQNDIALLELDSPIALAMVQPIRPGPVARARDRVTVVSYGRARDDHASIEEDCRVMLRRGAVSALSCSAVQGSSGAPVLRRTETGLEVAAVVSATGVIENRAASFAADVQDVLGDLMAARSSASNGGAEGGAAVRRLTVGDGGRGEIGARFLSP